MTHDDAVNAVRHELRIRLCGRCPWRSERARSAGSVGPAACEPRCAPFLHLPALVEAAELRDPMLESCAKAVGGAIDRILQGERADAHGRHDVPHVRLAPLKRYRNVIGRTIEAVTRA